MITIHGMQVSGNCYKLKLLLEQLGTPYRWIEVDLAQGGTRTPEFLALNPNGKVPILVLEDGRVLAESNAILCYLAEETRFLPEDRWQRAEVLQWLFFEQYSHEPYIAVARFIRLFLDPGHARHAELPRLLERGHQALAVIERHLEGKRYLVGDAWSIADIALYAYTHVAHEGGFDLSAYPAINAWLERARGQPGYVGIGT
ncbi:glutathione S-transferase family protein [Dokdonella sp.]|uniref:glutathione S-transferase family protein n=1 Tax=Dokdonella sp. TaxID=2291710 RepID=UPI002CDBB77C|nr:glutathione S-transferase family protein [Dokdonella sp.]HPN80860.1 glutathione S-transferase family protein [Dokdonella sp.]